MASQNIAIVPVPGARVAPDAYARPDARAASALPGTSFPLGATPGERLGKTGTNFAIASSVASGVTLCLFDEAGQETQIPLRENDADVWHAFVPGIGPGQAYGYRSAGHGIPRRASAATRAAPPRPLRASGRRNGVVRAGTARPCRGRPGHPERPRLLGAHPRSLSWIRRSSGRTPSRPWHRYSDTVLYEIHVKGFTMRHPGIPPELRGTYAGPGHEAAIAHLLDLGVTTVELLPVHHHVAEPFLASRGLTNYWGYNTIGFFAPHSGYSAAVRACASRRRGQRVQSDGGRHCTRRAWRSCSTWSSTTPPRRAWTVRRSASAGSTRGVLPARPGQPARLLRHDRLRQLAERR